MRDRGKGRGRGNIEGEKVGEMLLGRGTGEMMRGKGRMGGILRGEGRGMLRGRGCR